LSIIANDLPTPLPQSGPPDILSAHEVGKAYPWMLIATDVDAEVRVKGKGPTSFLP